MVCSTFLFSCSQTKPGWKTIDMGEYLIDVPNDFNLKFEKGVDSQVGGIKGKNFEFWFDYGPYSNELVATQQEFIEKGWWKDRAVMMYIYSRNHKVEWVNTKVLSYRLSTIADSTLFKGCDFVANCVYDNYQFQLPIFIPQEIKNHVVLIDSVDHYYRRLVYPRKGKTGETGVYMRKRKSGNDGILYSALVIGTYHIDNRYQGTALEIIKTLRPKPKTNTWFK